MQDRRGHGHCLVQEPHLTCLDLSLEDGSLEIGDTTTFSHYLHGGTVTKVKRTKTVNHVSASASEGGGPGTWSLLGACNILDTEPSISCRSPWTQPCCSPMWLPEIPTGCIACIRRSAHYTNSKTFMAGCPNPGIL